MGRQWLGVLLGVVVGACLAVGAIVVLSHRQPTKAEPKTSRQGVSSNETLVKGTRSNQLLRAPKRSGDAVFVVTH